MNQAGRALLSIMLCGLGVATVPNPNLFGVVLMGIAMVFFVAFGGPDD